MSNVSRCRFRSTLQDLQDCLDNLYPDWISGDEAAARVRLVETWRDIVARWDENEDPGEYDPNDDTEGGEAERDAERRRIEYRERRGW